MGKRLDENDIENIKRKSLEKAKKEKSLKYGIHFVEF